MQDCMVKLHRYNEDQYGPNAYSVTKLVFAETFFHDEEHWSRQTTHGLFSEVIADELLRQAGYIEKVEFINVPPNLFYFIGTSIIPMEWIPAFPYDKELQARVTIYIQPERELVDA